MNFSLPSLLAAALFAMPALVWADTYPDFDDDAKPILRLQPGLLQYVESKFDVKDTGRAKYPGDDDRPPTPPFIFEARPSGSSGPYTLRLLIQPGPMNRILNVVDMRKVQAPHAPSLVSHHSVPAPVSSSPAKSSTPPASSPATASSPAEPTADTPSGPIMGDGNQAPPAPASTQPSLQPPPDPAPAQN